MAYTLRIAVAAALVLLAAWLAPFFFMRPSDVALASYASSPQFDAAAERFRNPIPEVVTGERDSMAAMLADFLLPPPDRRPSKALPEHAFLRAAMREKSADVRFAWLGHSTVLLEMDGRRILFDPVFSSDASPVPFTAPRFQPPAWRLADLVDRVDAVVISHNHYDHLDEASILALADGPARFFTPLGVGQRLIAWGIDAARVEELDWWDARTVGELTLTATPAQHFSGRGFDDYNATLWAGWAVEGRRQVFFSGDTGYSPHFREIGERLGPFDLTFIENGAYSRNWPYVHQMPEEAVQAHVDLRGRYMVPIHWSMFTLAPHPWKEPVERAAAEAEKRGVALLSPEIGALVTLDGPLPTARWWEAL